MPIKYQINRDFNLITNRIESISKLASELESISFKIRDCKIKSDRSELIKIKNSMWVEYENLTNGGN